MELTNLIQEVKKEGSNNIDKLKNITEKLYFYKDLKSQLNKVIKVIDDQKRDLEKLALNILDENHIESSTLGEFIINVNVKDYVTIQTDESKKQILFDFLKKHNKEDAINVNSSKLNTLNKEFAKEFEQDETWVMPGLEPKTTVKSIKIKKI